MISVLFGPASTIAAALLAAAGPEAPSTFDRAAIAPAASDQIHLSWTADPATSFTVVFRSHDPEHPSLVQYRRAGERAFRVATGRPRASGTTGRLHEVTITGLTPASEYEYRVAGDGRILRARTAPAAGPADFDAIYMADTGLIGRSDGLATGTQQVIDEVVAMDPLFVLLGGDFAYFNTDKRFGTLERSIDAFFNQIAPLGTRAPLMPSYGNHEILLGEGFEPWAARFATPAGWEGGRAYSFDVGDVHFVSLFAGNEDDEGMTPAQLAWLERDLAAARKARRRWIVPFFHSAPFSNGSNHGDNLPLRAQLGPLFERHRVAVVLTSHDQSFERTYPLRGVPARVQPTSRKLRCYGGNDGVTWVKTGPGGKISNINRGFARFRSEPAPSFTAARDNTMHHVSRLLVRKQGALRVETFGVRAGEAAVLIDHFEYRVADCPDEPASLPPERLAFVERAGRLVIEAEHFDGREMRKPPGFRRLHSWEVRADVPGFSGDGFVEASPDERGEGASGPRSPRNADGAELRYHIHVSTAGVYNVWVRGYALGSDSNGVHLGVNGAFGTATALSGFRPVRAWRWENARKEEVGGGTARLDLRPGTHMLHVWMRDDGFRLDKIVLDRADAPPEGDGGGESPRLPQPVTAGACAAKNC